MRIKIGEKMGWENLRKMWRWGKEVGAERERDHSELCSNYRWIVNVSNDSELQHLPKEKNQCVHVQGTIWLLLVPLLLLLCPNQFHWCMGCTETLELDWCNWNFYYYYAEEKGEDIIYLPEILIQYCEWVSRNISN